MCRVACPDKPYNSDKTGLLGMSQSSRSARIRYEVMPSISFPTDYKVLEMLPVAISTICNVCLLSQYSMDFETNNGRRMCQNVAGFPAYSCIWGYFS